MRVGAGWLITMGILIGIGFDSWFAQILDITSILLTKVTPEVYKWVPSRELFPPLAINILVWWLVGSIILIGTFTVFRRLRTIKHRPIRDSNS